MQCRGCSKCNGDLKLNDIINQNRCIEFPSPIYKFDINSGSNIKFDCIACNVDLKEKKPNTAPFIGNYTHSHKEARCPQKPFDFKIKYKSTEIDFEEKARIAEIIRIKNKVP